MNVHTGGSQHSQQPAKQSLQLMKLCHIIQKTVPVSHSLVETDGNTGGSLTDPNGQLLYSFMLEKMAWVMILHKKVAWTTEAQEGHRQQLCEIHLFLFLIELRGYKWSVT